MGLRTQDVCLPKKLVESKNRRIVAETVRFETEHSSKLLVAHWYWMNRIVVGPGRTNIEIEMVERQRFESKLIFEAVPSRPTAEGLVRIRIAVGVLASRITFGVLASNLLRNTAGTVVEVRPFEEQLRNEMQMALQVLVVLHVVPLQFPVHFQPTATRHLDSNR